MVLLVVLAIAAIAFRATIAAQGRAIVVVATLLEVPILEGVVAAVTGEPEVGDTELVGIPTRVFRPAGGDPAPGILFLTGADAAGRESEDIARLGAALARAGYVTIVPELPGLADGAVTTATIDDAARVIAAAPALEGVRGGRVAVASVSAGASLAILATAREDTGSRVSVVAGIAPFARVRTVLQVAVTGGYTTDAGRTERYDTEPWLRRAVTTSLFASTDGGAAAEAVEGRLLERDDPVEAASRLDPAAVPDEDTRAVVELLGSSSPREFDARFDALPDDVRDAIDELSPLQEADRLGAPLELASSRRDRYFPLVESRLLVEAAPTGHLVVTDLLEHARPRLGVGDAGDLFAFDRFVVRVLRTAHERA